MSLLETTRKFIENQKLFGDLDRVLVAVSGGMDSMCLIHILHQLEYNISVAHVNYRLRGEASDLDQHLVTDFCNRNNIKCHIKKITQQESQTLTKQNLQEEARKIRYQFFKELKDKEGYQKVAIAHHQQDVVETFLMNAMRGSGSKGLRSIQATNGAIVRPFLTTPSKDISNYVSKYKIPYRTDESNHSNKYTRNYIRNTILPKLTERSATAINRISHSASLLSDEYDLLQHLIEQEKSEWVQDKNGQTEIGPISKLIHVPGHATLLWNILNPYGLSKSDLKDILGNYKQSGRNFSTSYHDIIINRDYIKIEVKRDKQIPALHIDASGVYENQIGILKIEDKISFSSTSPNAKVETIDLTKVEFPLTLRKWKQGDTWKPLGMKGRNKKISDYLIDQKIDQLAKNRTLVLTDAEGNIIWLVGHRISEIVKSTNDTVSYLHLTWVEK